jgi:hydroxymethylpyrimidine pyrophosphatase-like HAD family hydrolase
MLRWAGRAIAVGNAHHEVLAVADEITSSNDEDGVARVLEQVFELQPEA